MIAARMIRASAAAVSVLLRVVRASGAAGPAGAPERATDGTQSDYPSTLKDLSADGRHVLFSTSAPLVANDINGVLDLYVRDRDTDGDGVFDEPGAVRTILVSVGPAGEQLGRLPPEIGVFTGGTLSRDGRFVLFSTQLAARRSTTRTVWRTATCTTATPMPTASSTSPAPPRSRW